VRCCASQRLHQAPRGVHSCAQAAAAARVAGGREILRSAEITDGAWVFCLLIADADDVNKQLHYAYGNRLPPFAQVNYFSFLRSMHSAAFLCSLRLP
jgi:hypothetical protein